MTEEKKTEKAIELQDDMLDDTTGGRTGSPEFANMAFRVGHTLLNTQ